MKNINIQQLMLSLALVSLFSLSSAYGQDFEDAFGFEGDNVNDTTEAPIHMLLYLGLAIGGFIGVIKLRK